MRGRVCGWRNEQSEKKTSHTFFLVAAIQRDAAQRWHNRAAGWPMIVLRTTEGMDRAQSRRGKQVEGTGERIRSAGRDPRQHAHERSSKSG